MTSSVACPTGRHTSRGFSRATKPLPIATVLQTLDTNMQMPCAYPVSHSVSLTAILLNPVHVCSPQQQLRHAAGSACTRRLPPCRPYASAFWLDANRARTLCWRPAALQGSNMTTKCQAAHPTNPANACNSCQRPPLMLVLHASHLQPQREPPACCVAGCVAPWGVH